jgi:hypothetical protein
VPTPLVVQLAAARASNEAPSLIEKAFIVILLHYL